MFESIKNYYENNATLFHVTIIVMIACIVIGVAVIFAYKAVRKKRAAKEMEQKAIDELNASSAKPFDDYVEPSTDESEPQVSDETPSGEAPSEQDEDETAAAETALQEEEAPAEEPSVEQFAKEQADKIKESGPETEQKQVKAVKLENVDESPAETAPTKTAEPKKPAKPRYTGKWIISEEDGRYTATLLASNGEVLLRSESYSALSGVKSGIDTINKNIMKNNFALSIDKNGKYFFKLYSSSTRLLCISEVYGTKALCESAMESTKRFSQTAVVIVEKKEQ